MTLQVVRYTARPEQAEETETAIRDLFAAVETARPQGIRYLAARIADRPDFLMLLHLAEGVLNPLPGIPEAAAFRRRLAARAVAPPAPEPATVLGSYRMLG